MTRIKRKMKSLQRRLLITAAAAITLTVLAGGIPEELTSLLPSSATVSAPSAPVVPVVPDEQIGSLLEQVRTVEVLPEVDGYDRSCKRGQACSFGPAWNDPNDHSGCDTRSRILRSQLEHVAIKPGTQGCKVLSGVLIDPYTAEAIQFDVSDPAAVQIDHVFALGRSWDAGAAHWGLAQRVAFANDPLNLIAVGGAINREKSDSGLTWLPPNSSYRCPYIARYLTVAVTYGLAITTEERNIAAATCPAVAP